MILITELLLALVAAMLVVGVLGLAFGSRGPWNSLPVLFLVVFLGTWAIATWAAPVGPVVRDVAWVPFLVAALLLGLLLAAIPRRDRTIELTPTPAEAQEETSEAGTALGILFWVLVVALLVLAIMPAPR